MIDANDTSRYGEKPSFMKIALSEKGEKVAKEILKEMIIEGKVDPDVIDVEFDDEEFQVKLFAERI